MKRVIFFIVFIFSAVLYGERVISFPDLFKPSALMVNENRLYIVEFPHIFIYSLTDNKLINKIGEAGEGPKEFKGNINLLPNGENFTAYSRGKISIWSRDGEFIKEQKWAFSFGIEPCDDVLVGVGRKRNNNLDPYVELFIEVLDKSGKKIREIDRKKMEFPGIRQLMFFTQPYLFYILDHSKIVVPGHQGFLLNIFDKYGKKLFDIRRDYVKREVTESDRQKCHDWYKQHPRLKQFYDEFRNKFKFAKYYPAIRGFQVFDSRIYIWTYNRRGSDTEFYIYDNNGKWLKTVFLPLNEKDVRTTYPFFIHNDAFYHLIENEDEESFELHKVDIDLREKAPEK